MGTHPPSLIYIAAQIPSTYSFCLTSRQPAWQEAEDKWASNHQPPSCKHYSLSSRLSCVCACVCKFGTISAIVRLSATTNWMQFSLLFKDSKAFPCNKETFSDLLGPSCCLVQWMHATCSGATPVLQPLWRFKTWIWNPYNRLRDKTRIARWLLHEMSLFF